MPIIDLHDPRFTLTMRLVEAARQQRLDEVRALLDAGAPADGLIYQRFNALHYAVEFGNQEMAKALLDAGAVGFDPAMIRAEPVLHRVLVFQQDAFALWWLGQPDPSFDPNRRNADGFTALHLLALHPATPMNVVERLLIQGADPRLTTRERPRRPNGSEALPGTSGTTDDVDEDQRPRDALDIARDMDARPLVARLEQWVLLREKLVAGPTERQGDRPRL